MPKYSQRRPLAPARGRREEAEILKATIDAGLGTGTVKPREFRRVTVDTTVQDKAVTFPTDGKLLNRSRARLVKLCRRHGVVLRQSYARKGPQSLVKANRYAHARQLRRMRRQVNRLRTYPYSSPFSFLSLVVGD